MERVELQEVVEAFLIVSVTALNFAVVPRDARTEDVIEDTQPAA